MNDTTRRVRAGAVGLGAFLLFVGLSRITRPSPDDLSGAEATHVLERTLSRVRCRPATV